MGAQGNQVNNVTDGFVEVMGLKNKGTDVL